MGNKILASVTDGVKREENQFAEMKKRLDAIE